MLRWASVAFDLPAGPSVMTAMVLLLVVTSVGVAIKGRTHP